jgi:N-acetylmuramoyl-L-alanine amidase
MRQKIYMKSGKHMRTFVAALLLLSFTVLASAAEFRGLIIRGSDWAYEKSAEEKQEALRNILSEAKEQHFNSIIFQIREAGECYYPSSSETWSSLFGERDPGFDPLAFVLREAHQQQLQLIVQMDVLSAYSFINKPASPEHISRKKAKWLLADEQNEPLREDIYYYLDPFNPEVVTYIKKNVAEITDRYNIDGFYFSELKYPNDKILKTKTFQQQYQQIAAFSGKSEEDVARDMISNILEAAAAEIRIRKPYLLIFAECEALPYEVKKYRDIKPADSYYFQQGQRWLEDGLIDVLVPKIFTRHRDFEDIYSLYETATDTKQNLIPLLQGDEDIYRDQDVRKSLQHVRKLEGSGILLHSVSNVLSGKPLFDTAEDLPYLSLDRGTVNAVEIDLNSLNIHHDIVKLSQKERIRMLDQHNILNLILRDLPRTLRIETMDAVLRYSTREWVVPYRYQALSTRELVRPERFVELRKAPGLLSVDSAYQFLFRASPGDTRINGEPVKAYPYTGVFFQWIPFKPYGKRTLVRGSVHSNGDSVYYEDVFFGNIPDTSSQHALIMSSVSPQGTVLLPPDDQLRVSFRSDLADQMDTILVYANGQPFPLWHNGTQYIGEIPTAKYILSDTVFIQVAARDIGGKEYSYNLPIKMKVLPREAFPLIETTEDFVPFSYSLGLVRLGGPYLYEYPKKVRFATDAKFGSDYRVRLNATEVAYVNERYVRELAPNTPEPAYNLTSMSAQPDSNMDRVIIPRPEPVPYTVFPEPEQKRIRIRLYGVHSNSTWISHRSGLKLIDYVSWQQVDATTYDVLVYLTSSNIWGYDLKQQERFLSLELRYPPKQKKLRIALEAGHGGEWNWGAIGLSGLKEKDVNLDVTQKTRDILAGMGYEVIEIRPEDSSPMLRERWLLTDSLKADIFVSIHANAAGGDYLRVSGTSTYYNNPFWRDFATSTYTKLLELPLEEFGVVGSFNYMMCRMSQRPSILVELAFMSHAEDESKLANPEFRSDMAQKVAESVHAYILNKLKNE